MTETEQEARVRIVDGLTTLISTGRITKAVFEHYVAMLDELLGEQPPKKVRKNGQKQSNNP